MSLALRSAARSDVGLVRSGNEDSGYAGDTLLVVADGMGGHAAGELASATAIATMSETETTGLADVEALERLSEAVSIAGERIADLVAAHPEWAGMGTTLTALAWLGGDPARVAVLHVGDSRAYLLRDGEFTQITRDHTYVQTLIDSGRISPEEAAVHPRRNLLMRAIDGVHTAEPDVSVREARAGDRFLVCSDGLSGYVNDDDMHALLGLADPTAAVTALVDAALEAGAPDNVTCVVADVVTGEEHTALEPVVVGAAGEPRNRDRLPGMAFPVDSQPDARPVLTVTSATGGASASVAEIYREEQPGRTVRRSKRWWWVGTALIAIAAVIGISLFALYSASQRQYYVGSDAGYVAIFRGLPVNVGPFDLHSVEERTDLTVDSLPDFEAMQVQTTIQTDSLGAAEQVVQRLTERAAQCVSVPSTPGCPDAGSGDSATPSAPTATASP